ncbi:MAG: hypothetical protein VW397_07105 [Candidatus Margulisiibacteriota bacterium]
MSLSKVWFIILTIALGVFSQNAQISVVPQSINWLNSRGEIYSPFDKKGYYHKAILELNVPSNLIGEYYIGIALDNNDIVRTVTGQDHQQEIAFKISSQTNTNYSILDWPMISSNQDVLTFQLKGNNLPIVRIPIYIWVDPGQRVTPGEYKTSLGINIYDGPLNIGGLGNLVSSGKIGLVIQVSNQIEVSVGDDTFNQFTDFNIKFEQLKEGEVVNYEAFINSVGNYNIILISANKGVLKHHLDQVKTTIPYQLYFDDELVDLGTSGEFRKSIEKDAYNEKSTHRIKLVLGNASSAFKGSYTDRISLKAYID